MKRIFLVVTIIFFTININAQTTFNGILDSTVSVTANDGDFSYGIEEYANLRFQSRLRDNRAAVFGAVNLIAAAGDYAREMVYANPSGVIRGENYITAIELERLYFRLNFEKVNIDGGLFRLPFGYSTVWGPSDFLNPKNPLKPDARPRGVPGTVLNVFPINDIKLTAFAAAARNPYINEGDEIRTGLSFENHWSRASAQVLYSYELPYRQNENYLNKWYGIHRAGLSVKADVKAGIIIDALYTYNYAMKTKREGLSLSAGADYSFIDGRLIVLAEYLYNGGDSSTALSADNPLGMLNRHYIYSSLTWLFNDFTNVNIALISCLDKVNFNPILSFNHELLQGATLIITAQADLDLEIYNLSAKLRLRF